MGNSPSGCGPRLLGNGKYCSYHVKLDNAATITVTKHQEITNDQEKRQEWELKYDVDGMTSRLWMSIERTSDDEYLSMILVDSDDKIKKDTVNILIQVKKEKEEYVRATSIYLTEHKPIKSGRSLRAGVETQYKAYGSGTRMGLLVTETKKKNKNNEEQAYMVTVAHYYVNSGRNCGGDIGFSVVVKIGVHNGQLDFSVDGPVEHPSSALVYMIQEVIRTGTWKLSSCPHCKNIQSQRRWLSESEDSDTTLPPPPRYGGSQNAANMGRFNGDGNGSFIQANKKPQFCCLSALAVIGLMRASPKAPRFGS
ncbi:hypothetical protein ACSQ67_009469 [Phaseolus vulgaris]